MNYKTFFKGKHIAVVGLGPHGEMVADIKFLLKTGALVSLYDIRSENRMQGPLSVLRTAGLTRYELGTPPGESLLQSELIILSQEIPKDSLFLKKVYNAGIRIEYPDVLFLKLAPPITLIGIMGQCGKSTVAHMLYAVLKQSFKDYEAQGLYFIDPDLPNGALTHLKKIKQGDVILARITEEMLGEYHEARISPHVAVITSLTSSAMEGVPTAFAILEHQTYNNFIVATDIVIDNIKSKSNFTTKAKMLRTRSTNQALAIQTAELFKVPVETAQGIIDNFTGLRSHQELVKKIDGVEFYNDSASVTPLATVFALQTLQSADAKNIVLILGGAYTKHDYSELISLLSRYVSSVILLPGTGSLGLRESLETMRGIRFLQAPTLEDAVIMSKGESRKGDKVIFSPAFEAVGIHISRKDRGEKFVKAVRSL